MSQPLFEPLHPVQKAAFQRMTLHEKLALVNGSISFARDLKLAYLKKQYPEWTQSELDRELARNFLHASS